MFKPSTAPRWKMATSVFRRPVAAASTVRARNDGAKPSVTMASPPFRMKTRREIIRPLLFLEFRRAQHERRQLRYVFCLAQRRRRGGGDVVLQHGSHQT